MADPYRTFSPGDPLPRDAATFNAFSQAARLARDNSVEGAGTGQPIFRQGDIVKVKNESGRDLLRGGILGLDDPIFLPPDAEDAFLREVTFRGIIPTAAHIGKFAVLLDPAPDDRVVRAYVSGVCMVRVDIADINHTHAEISVGDTFALVTSNCGSAQILFMEDTGYYYGGYDYYYGANTKWATIRIGVACDCLGMGKTRGSTTAARSGTTVSSSIVDEYTPVGTGTTATLTATGKSFRVFNLSNQTVAASVYVGYSCRGGKYVFDLEDC